MNRSATSKNCSRRVWFATVAVFAVDVLGSFSRCYSQETPQVPSKASRFDHSVREDFFAGFEGDADRLGKGMKQCEAVLAKNPDQAEAMVWLGSGQVYIAGQAFAKGEFAKGMEMWTKGLANMDRAALLEPTNIGVLIPRAATLMPASRGLPKVVKDPVLKGVLKNFLDVYEVQKNDLRSIGEHPLGELRMGLADVYRSLGEMDKSKGQLESVLKELPETDYSKRAKEWLEAKPNAKLEHNCIGCHSK